MKYFLDTDTCIFMLQGKFPSLIEKFKKSSPDKIKIPSIVKAELLVGAKKGKNSKHVTELIENFLEPFEVISFCDKCTGVYSIIRCDLEEKGKSIDPNDLIIAATAYAHQGILVTHNIKEFSRISFLKIQDWCNAKD